ncbi:MAG: beta-propeller fold lactonase family protein [Phycisphaerae bacterium]|jgi:6-phosphogluconolactonase (cycloisomerase 2 family)
MRTQSIQTPFARGGAVILVAGGLVFSASAQMSERAAFVAHNYNLAGSVSSFRFNAGGQPVLVDNVATPSTNAYAISLSPSGQHLAVSHATGNDDFEDLDIVGVAADGSLTVLRTFLVDDSPLDAEWITDELLAVTKTNVSLTNQIVIYRFNAEELALTEIDRENLAGFSTNIAVHPSRQYIYVQSTGPNTIHCFSVAASGALTQIEAQSTGSYYPLGMSVTHDGTKLYATGGISGTGHEVIGASVNADGSLTMLGTSPYNSPGTSPKDTSITADDAYVFVAHGTDATVRSFALDGETGVLTYTGNSFDVGLQGSLGDAVVLDELLLVTDNTTATDGIKGLYAFTIHANGSFTSNGPIVDTGSSVPQEIAVWSPAAPCPADLDGDGDIDLADLSELLTHFGGAGTPEQGDLDGDGDVDLADLSALLEVYGTSC